MLCVVFCLCNFTLQPTKQPTNQRRQEKKPRQRTDGNTSKQQLQQQEQKHSSGEIIYRALPYFLIFFIGEHSGSDPFCVPFHSVLVLHRTCGTYYCPGRHPHPTRYTGQPASWKIGETGGERHRNEERWATISWGANLIISTLGCRLEKRCV